MTYAIFKSKDGFRIIANERNLKFAGNFRLIESETEPTDEQCEAAFAQPVAPTFTARDWMLKHDFDGIACLALKELEDQLAAASLTSEKLAAVRQWLNGLLATYATNPVPRSDWPAPPHPLNETTAEAFALLEPNG